MEGDVFGAYKRVEKSNGIERFEGEWIKALGTDGLQ